MGSQTFAGRDVQTGYEQGTGGFLAEGKDALLVATLSYNVGYFRLVGYGKIPKSRLIQKLEAGDRDIYNEYVSFRCYKGKVVPSIERRRKVEYMLLFKK